MCSENYRWSIKRDTSGLIYASEESPNQTNGSASLCQSGVWTADKQISGQEGHAETHMNRR
jgi:hypothetical protein